MYLLLVLRQPTTVGFAGGREIYETRRRLLLLFPRVRGLSFQLQDPRHRPRLRGLVELLRVAASPHGLAQTGGCHCVAKATTEKLGLPLLREEETAEQEREQETALRKTQQPRPPSAPFAGWETCSKETL